ncbi:MAG: hypothetical protein AAF441_11080 [Pseudomonadota bacterium]
MTSADSGEIRRGQLALNLSFRPAMSREDFLVASSNEAAVRMVDLWPDWPAASLLLVGPEGSGKSHLAEVFRMRAGGAKVQACELSTDDVPALLSAGACVVEDLPLGSGPEGETALFHLLNLAKETRGYVLLTARSYPALWNIGLNDLKSRLNASPAVALGTPSDALLRGLLLKLFADRQISVDESVLSYLVRNMERSGEAARSIVNEIDRRSLEEKAAVTRPFASKVLRSVGSGEFADSGT